MQTENNMKDPPRGWAASMFSQFRFFGWIVILATAYCLMVGSGLFFYAMSVLLELIVVNTGYSVAQISLANTIFLAMSGFAGVIVGELITRYDIRFSVTAGSLVLLLSYVLLAEANSLTAIYVIYGMIGIGYAMTALVPATTLVARWFIRRRALALAVAHSGLSLGGVLLTPILANLVTKTGMAALTHPVIVFLILLMVPVSALAMHPNPAQMGLHPDGDDVDPEAPPAHEKGWRAQEAVRTRFFGFLVLAAMFVMMAQVGTIAHIYNWGLARADAQTGALTIAVMAFCSFSGRLITGSFLDHIDIYPFVIILFLAQAMTLFGIAFAEGVWPVLIMSGLFGLTVGNVLMSQPLLIGAAFGVRDFPRILSYNQLLMNIGVAAGPLFVGLIYDFGGGYRNAFVIVGMASLLACTCLILAGSPARLAEDAKSL
ncbi:MAG: MFS transporter [Rhodobiaceae bacterium]